VQARRRAGHKVVPLQEGAFTVTVPAPDHKEVRVGTSLSTLHQARVRRALFAKS